MLFLCISKRKEGIIFINFLFGFNFFSYKVGYKKRPPYPSGRFFILIVSILI